MAKFKGLENVNIVDFAVASGLEEFTLNGEKIFGDDQDRFYVSQTSPGVIEIKERNVAEGQGWQQQVVFTINIIEHRRRDWD